MKYAITGKTVLVAGLGRSGLAAAELLRSKGAKVRAADSQAGLAPAGIQTLPQNRETFTAPDLDLIVLSPGVPVDLPELQAARVAGIAVIGEVELAGYYLRGPIIGITGSNGKTTTTAMVGHILTTAGVPCQVGGNIGTPPTAMLEASRDDQWNVLELSSFQLETVYELRIKIAAGLNVTPDHLDRHGTLARYAEAKARLFDLQSSEDFAVLNADDVITSSWGTRAKGRVHWFSRRRHVDPGVSVVNNVLQLDGNNLIPIAEIPLPGTHNLENAMAAAAIASLAGASLAGIAEGIRSFAGVEHRIEFVRELQGVRYYNDSKATNVDAARKAIDSFDGNLWIILGGKDKDSDYSALRDELRKKARGLLLIGAASGKIAKHLAGLPLIESETLENAVKMAASRASKGDVVLLSPACASFDQFQNYEHRGRVFKELVRGL